MTRCHSCRLSPAILSGPAGFSTLCRSCRSLPNKHPPTPSFSRSRLLSTPSSHNLPTPSSSLPPSQPSSSRLLSADTSPPPPKRCRTSLFPPSSSSDSPSSSPSTSPPLAKPLARTVVLPGELLRLRKERLTVASEPRRKLPGSLADTDDSLSEDPDDDVDEPGHERGFARLRPTPPLGRHWPGRDTVLAVRRALFPQTDTDTSGDPPPLQPRREKVERSRIDCGQVRARPESLRREELQPPPKRLREELLSRTPPSHFGGLPLHSDDTHVRSEPLRRGPTTPQRPPLGNNMSARLPRRRDEVPQRWDKTSPRMPARGDEMPAPPPPRRERMPIRRDKMSALPPSRMDEMPARSPSRRDGIPVRRDEMPTRPAPRRDQMSARLPPRHRDGLPTRPSPPSQHARARPFYRTAPLTAWPRPRVRPGFSSYTDGAALPGREVRSAVHAHVSDSANAEPDRSFVRQRDFLPSRPTTQRHAGLRSNLSAVPYERHGLKRSLFPRDSLEERRSYAPVSGVYVTPRRELPLLRSVPNERRVQKQPLFVSPAIGREPRTVSKPFNRPTKRTLTTLDRAVELKERLAEIRQMKARTIARADAEERRERSVARLESWKREQAQPERLPLYMPRRSSVPIVRKDKRPMWDQTDIVKRSSPVTSSGERMRHAVVESRDEWRRSLAEAAQANQADNQATGTTYGERMHLRLHEQRRERATAIARPPSSALHEYTTNPRSGQPMRGALEERSREGGRTPIARPSSPRNPESGRERPTVRAPQEAQKVRCLPDEVPDNRKNGQRRGNRAGDVDNFDGMGSVNPPRIGSIRRFGVGTVSGSRTVSKDRNDAMFTSPRRVGPPAIDMSQKGPTRVQPDSTVADDLQPMMQIESPLPQRETARAESGTLEDTTRRKKSRSFTIKAACRYGWASSTRRLSVGYTMAFAALKNQLEIAFEMTKPFAVTYRDEDGDFVKVSSDAEMTHFFDMARRHTQPMKVKLIPPHGNLAIRDD